MGPSLLSLAPTLQVLDISLAHELEHFIVSHPRIDWTALRSLTALRWLRISGLAVYAFFPLPEVTWSDEAPAAHEADALLAALLQIEEVQLRFVNGLCVEKGGYHDVC